MLFRSLILICTAVICFSCGAPSSNEPMLNISKEKDPISNFWNWFVNNKTKLENINDNNRDELLDAVLEQLHKINDGLSVEISNEFEGIRDIVISAEGDKSNFPIVTKIVSAAPQIQGWTITAFRQPVGIDFTLEYKNLKFTPSEMFFSPLVREESLDLIIYAKGIKGQDSNTVAHYGLITMDNVLGEYDCVTKVRYYDFHDLDDKVDKSSLLPLTQVRSFVDSFHKQKK